MAEQHEAEAAILQAMAAVGSEVPLPSGDLVAKVIARKFNVSVPVLLGQDRHRKVMRARKTLYRTLRAMGWSYSEIGEFVGGRDHTTIIMGIRTVRRSKKEIVLSQPLLPAGPMPVEPPSGVMEIPSASDLRGGSPPVDHRDVLLNEYKGLVDRLTQRVVALEAENSELRAAGTDLREELREISRGAKPRLQLVPPGE
jgi:hypothetical protein